MAGFVNALNSAASSVRGRLAKVGGGVVGGLGTILTSIGLADGHFGLGTLGAGTRAGGMMILLAIILSGLAKAGMAALGLSLPAVRRWILPFALLVASPMFLFLAMLPGFPAISIIGLAAGLVFGLTGIIMIFTPVITGKVGAILAIVLALSESVFGIVCLTVSIMGGGLLG